MTDEMLPPVQSVRRGRGIGTHHGVRSATQVETIVPLPTPRASGDIDIRISDGRVDHDNPDALTLSLRATADGAEIVGVSATPLGRARAARLATAIAARGPHGLDELDIIDWPRVPHRGVLECFYGAPWSPGDRLRLVAEAASWGFNFYCYGSAGDERTSSLWRDHYAADELADFRDLVDSARRWGIDVAWRVSPSAPLAPENGIRFHRADDREALWDKMSSLLDTGIRTFLITFDDLNEGLSDPDDLARYGSGPQGLARAHGEVANDMARRLSAHSARLLVCPTLYWGTRPSAYRAALVRELDPGIDMWWTGPEVTAFTIGADDVRAIAGEYPAAPWIWDNYPVNDWDSTLDRAAGPRRRRLFLGPLRGREEPLADSIGAYAINMGEEPHLGIPAMATAGLWAWCPRAYDPERAWRFVARQPLLGDPDNTLASYVDLVTPSTLTASAPTDLSRAVARYQFALECDPAQRPDAAAVLLSEIAAARSRIALRTEFDRLISEWSDRFVFELHILEHTVLLLEAIEEGDGTARRRHANVVSGAREQLDDPDAVLAANGMMLALIERGRAVAGAPSPPGDDDI